MNPLNVYRIINPQRPGAKSGAAFGATLYRNFVLSCPTVCDVPRAFRNRKQL